MATPIAISTGSQNLAVPRITRSQEGTASSGKSMSGHGMDGRSTSGEPIGDPVQHRLQQKPNEQCQTKQPRRNPADGTHDVTGGVQPRIVPLEDQQQGCE